MNCNIPHYWIRMWFLGIEYESCTTLSIPHNIAAHHNSAFYPTISRHFMPNSWW